MDVATVKAVVCVFCSRNENTMRKPTAKETHTPFEARKDRSVSFMMQESSVIQCVYVGVIMQCML
jgi:hypothetical protein